MNSVNVILNEDSVCVTVHGSSEFLCAIGQQLAWLGSVCQFPEIGLSYCDTLWSFVETTEQNSRKDPHFEINYRVAPFDEDEIRLCWHDLVTDSTIATGFPMQPRSIDDKGHQVPMEIMAALVGVSIVVDVGSGYFIKGETCAVYPVHRNKITDHVQWHISDNDKKSFEYLDMNIESLPLAKLSLEEINSTVAFLGWTQSVMNCAGKSSFAPKLF